MFVRAWQITYAFPQNLNVKLSNSFCDVSFETTGEYIRVEVVIWTKEHHLLFDLMMTHTHPHPKPQLIPILGKELSLLNT